jgi:PAS domain S-box-containing protein
MARTSTRLILGFVLIGVLLAAGFLYQVFAVRGLAALQAQIAGRVQEMLEVRDIMYRVVEVYAVVAGGAMNKNLDEARRRFDADKALAGRDIATVEEVASRLGNPTLARDFSARYRAYLSKFEEEILPLLQRSESTRNRFPDALIISNVAQHVDEIHLMITDAIIRGGRPDFTLHGTTSYDATVKGFQRIKNLVSKDLDDLRRVVTPSERIWVDTFDEKYGSYLDRVEHDLLPLLEETADRGASPASAGRHARIQAIFAEIDALHLAAKEPLEQMILSLQWDGFLATQSTAALRSSERLLSIRRVQLMGTLQEVSDTLERKNEDTVNMLTVARRRVSLTWEAVSVATGILALLVGLLVTRSIVMPLGKLVRISQGIAHGDFSQEIRIGRPAEVAALAGAFSVMKSSIQNVLQETHGLISAVQEGRTSPRGRSEAFEGGWRDLIDEVNRLTDAFAHATAQLREAKSILETRVADSEEKFRSMVEQVPEIYYTVEYGTEPRTTYISPQVHAILGFSPEEWLADPELWIRQIHPEDRDRVLTEVRLRESLGQPINLEYRVLTRDGRLRWLNVRSTLISEASGVIHHANGVMLDVTDRHAADELLREKDEQLLHAQKMEAIGRLAGGVAHDFNNLLTVIIGYAGMLLESAGARDPHYSEIEEIQKAANRAKALTDQLLAFSRKQILQAKVMSVNQRVRGMESMLRRLIGESIRLSIRLEAAAGFVKADPGQIDQVIMNIAVNAHDAMPEGGELVIETTNRTLTENAREPLGAPDGGRGETTLHGEARPGSYVVLSISDTGQGMDAETLSRIFEPFFTTKDRGKGTGLGLAMVYGIVAQSGGFIAVQSAKGTGTVFQIFLPRVDSREVEKQKETPAFPPVPGTGTILLVEDEDMVKEYIRSILTRAGYAVLVASNGRDALERVASRSDGIDLLLTDVIMPEMGGKELQDRIRTAFPNIKAIFMSGYTEDAILRQGVIDGKIEFLRKPFGSAELLAKVAEVLGSLNKDL